MNQINGDASDVADRVVSWMLEEDLSTIGGEVTADARWWLSLGFRVQGFSVGQAESGYSHLGRRRPAR